MIDLLRCRFCKPLLSMKLTNPVIVLCANCRCVEICDWVDPCGQVSGAVLLVVYRAA